MTRKPFVFIGSSGEGKQYAEALQLNLRETCECQIWNQGLFGLSDGTIETLIRSLDKFDFAILLITGDDLLISKGSESRAPRDNVIFELGLFMGGLQKQRVYIVINSDDKPKLPSDLAGVTVATFDRPVMGNLQSALGPAATLIKEEVKTIGLRTIVETSKNNYENDIRMITNYLTDKELEMISFETLSKNVHDKFDRDYILKLIEANPDKIRKAILSGNREGIKIFNLSKSKNPKRKLIWKENFDNLIHWNMNYWGSNNPEKTNRIENSEMIFEANPEELLNPNKFYGAYIDIDSRINCEEIYSIECKVRSSSNTTMGFQIWVHDCKKDNNNIIEPMFPKTPNTASEIIKLEYTATETNALRIHLHCKAGNGKIIVEEVSIYHL